VRLPIPPHDLDRRQFPRVDAAIFVRPVSILVRAIPWRAHDVSLAGLCTYSDEHYRVGARLELELQLQGLAQAVVLAEVVWIQATPAGAPARYDVGLRFVDANELDLALIRRALAAQDGLPESAEREG
jgi:hypothetical protein